MKLLIVDTETTGLDPESAEVIEVAGILYDVELRGVIAQCSFLSPAQENPAMHINRIRPELSNKMTGGMYLSFIEVFYGMAKSADFALAHNAAFDKKWFTESQGLFPLDLQWICSMEDIRWPRNSKKGKPGVTSLALDYGVPVWSAHRALTDCTYLVEIMRREKDMLQLIQEAFEPTSVYVSLLGYEDRQQCKDAGFRWNELVPGKWAKSLRKREAAAVPFPIQEVAI